MLEWTQGNILESDAEALVNPVNCVGVMGRGLALQFKKAYPNNFAEYAEACEDEWVNPGIMHLCVEGGKLIINFPTKRHWKDPSRLAYIEDGLDDLMTLINEFGLESIAIPRLGCGLGGLDWGTVKPLIVRKMAGTSARVIVYE